MNKITFFIGSMSRGGAERVVSLLANNFSSSNIEVDIVCLLDNKIEYNLNSDINLIDFSRKNKSRIFNIFYWIKNIRNYLKKNKESNIISFVARINILVLFSSLGMNNKITVSERNDPKNDGRNILVKLFTYILYPFSELIVFQTNYAKRCFPNFIQKNSIVIPNPIDVNIKKVNYNKTNKIISVGRLAAQKNHSMLIDAFAQVIKHHPNYVLNIYGDGELKEVLENKIYNKMLSDNIRIYESTNDIHKIMLEHDFIVQSSLYEGLSNVMLEAMVIGLPVITTDCAGVDEYIKNNDNGIIVNNGNETELTDAIIKLISFPDEREKIGHNSQKIMDLVDSNSVLNEWKRILNT